MDTRNFRTGFLVRIVAGITLALSFCCAAVSLSETRAAYAVEKAGPSDFLPKLRQAARELELLYKNVRIEGTHVATRPGRPSAKGQASSKDQAISAPRTVIAKFSYARSEGREKLVLSPPEEAVSGTAVVSSGLRKFRLMRKGAGGSWYVETDVNTDDDWPAMMRYRNWLTAAAYSPGGFPRFLEYVNSADFRIRDVSQAADEGVDLVKVLFEYVPKDPQKPRLEGWLRLDPAMSSVIRDYEFNTRLSWLRDGVKGETNIRNKGFVKYTQANGKPVPREMELSRYFNGRATTDHVSISDFRFALSAPEEFTLAEFGLGDYERTASEVQTRATYRSATLALGAFLAAFVLFRIGRSIQKGRSGAGATVPGRAGGSQPLESPS